MSRWFPLLLALASSAAAADEAVPAFAPVKVAVLDVETAQQSEAPLAASASNLVSARLTERGLFEVITQEDVRRMIAFDEMKTALTCDDDASCLADIGGALGVPYLVAGTLARVGDTWLLGLTLVDIDAARPLGRETLTAKSSDEVLAGAARLIDKTVAPLVDTLAGTLAVRSAEPGATVEIDGRAVGVTPLAEPLPLAPGAHRVVANKKGFLVWERDVDVPPRGGASVHIELVPEPISEAEQQAAQVSSTILWTGGGILALGASATAGLVTGAFVMRALQQDPASPGESKLLAQNAGPVFVYGALLAFPVALVGGGLITASLFIE